ncbi:MAG: hypothetical protein FWE22_01845 [Firmicutes bacterium]|nr:hypothetical protein [Bacillota bacterium]
MKNAVWTCEYKLKKNVDEIDFLAISEVLGKEYISKQKGFISWKQLKGADTWVDLLNWETMEDAKNFENSGGGGKLAEKFYSFINLMSCKVRCYTVKKTIKLEEMNEKNKSNNIC